MPHLSYIGDAEVGEDTNVAAGNITVNFPHEPGRRKAGRRSAGNAVTGVQNAFVALVEVGDDAWIAAGSVITKDVPLARSGSPGHGRRTKRGTPVETATELSLPGLDMSTPAPEPKPGHWLGARPAEAAHGVRGPVASPARAANGRASRRRAGRRRVEDVRERRDVRSVLRVDPRRRRVPRADRMRARRSKPDGAAAGDPGGEARVREAGSRRSSPGSPTAPDRRRSPGADLRPARRRHAPTAEPTAC